jgi:hypothetical protein
MSSAGLRGPVWRQSWTAGSPTLGFPTTAARATLAGARHCAVTTDVTARVVLVSWTRCVPGTSLPRGSCWPPLRGRGRATARRLRASRPTEFDAELGCGRAGLAIPGVVRPPGKRSGFDEPNRRCCVERGPGQAGHGGSVRGPASGQIAGMSSLKRDRDATDDGGIGGPFVATSAGPWYAEDKVVVAAHLVGDVKKRVLEPRLSVNSESPPHAHSHVRNYRFPDIRL